MTLGALIRQKSYEKVVLVARRHPITFLPYIVLFLILLAVPFGLRLLLNISFLGSFLDNQTGHPLAILLASIYYLSVLLFFYTNFVTFHLDIWVITNDRLLDMEQKNLFSRTISELDLYQVQDAASEVNGFLQTIFNYGTVDIQTAGTVDKFTFRNVSHPNKLRQLILDLSAEDKKYHEKQS